jgi:hypothetical protein
LRGIFRFEKEGEMHPPSQRNKTIGKVGLAWFLFCTGASVSVLLDPDGFRRISKYYTWTDREILIGAVCYFVAGLGGLVLVVTRLILPFFARRPRIGYGAATPVLAVDVLPRFEDFHALHALASARAARTATLFTLAAGLVIFLLVEQPTWRNEGVPLRVGLTIFGAALVIKALFPLVRSAFSRSRWCCRLRWSLFGRHREPRRYHVFEDGILVQGRSFQRIVPWYDVRHVHFIGDTIGLVGRGELITIPTTAMPSPDAAAQFIQLLDRKALYSSISTATNVP